MSGKLRIIFTATPGTIMVVSPNGDIQFFDGFWAMLRLAWQIVKAGCRYEIEDHRNSGGQP